jgi:hypothetical protein
MSKERIIAGAPQQNLKKDEGFIAGDKKRKPASEDQSQESTIEHRIKKSTESGGLKTIPTGFDNHDGDWVVINSANPFEVLYLDYKQYLFISPETVKTNYEILKSFWEEKTNLLNTGGNRIAFKNKFGDGTVEQSLTKLKKAYEKLNSKENIKSYFLEIDNKRLKNGENSIRVFIEQMLVDGVAERREINFCIEQGKKNGLSDEETANIIEKDLIEKGYRPCRESKGKNVVDKLLSIESWLTQEEFDKAEKERKEKEKQKIQILPGRYAKNLEEIGLILFEDEGGARELISEDIIKSAVAQKDTVIASQIAKITKSKNSSETKYLEIIYKLNTQLPYRLTAGALANSVEELCSIIFSQTYFKLGQEHFKKGLIEIWLQETNQNAYNRFVQIRDTAENFELAFLEFIYTFNKELPFRLENTEVTTPIELFDLINNDEHWWESGKKALFNKAILLWLKAKGKTEIVDKWNKIKEEYSENKDLGLEAFLLLLNSKALITNIKTSVVEIEHFAIQRGKTVKTEIQFENTTRGYSIGLVSFSKEIEGVEVSKKYVNIHSAFGILTDKIDLSIDSNKLRKGVVYETQIIVTTTAGQTIEIPVKFKVIFPINAFVLEIIKYAALFAIVFGLTRYLLSLNYSEWLTANYDYYLSLSDALSDYQYFYDFAWIFLAFALSVLLIFRYLIKYLRKATDQKPNLKGNTNKEKNKQKSQH